MIVIPLSAPVSALSTVFMGLQRSRLVQDLLHVYHCSDRVFKAVYMTMESICGLFAAVCCPCPRGKRGAAPVRVQCVTLYI